MTNPAGFDFTKFVPGFDFLKNLTPGGGATASSAAPGWVAPTLDPEELEKRIQELKTVQFWLEQNTNALKATIQALEVQKMTLSTLQGMNVNMADLAKAFTAKMPDLNAGSEAKAAEEKTETPSAASSTATNKPEASAADKEAPAVDPMQWWGSLTQQFQNIAAAAVKDVAAKAMKETPKPATQKAAAKRPSRAKKTGAASKTAATQSTANDK
jgi:hypothetical protein